MSQRRQRANTVAMSQTPIAWTFFRQWLKNPLGIAALSPSSRHLARAMIDQLPANTERVIELGGGTGVFTRALIDHGIGADHLMVVELNEALYQLLKQRFPDTKVACGDARQLAELVRRENFAEAGDIDAVISGLGMLSMSRPVQREILGAVFDVLKATGCFIQFTYGPVSPVSRELLDELGLNVRRASMAWRNVPPATVFVYTRNRSTGVRAVRAAPR